MNQLETELRKATNTADAAPKAGADTRQDYLVQLTHRANELSDPKFKALSREAKLWVNAAVKSIKAKKAIVDFPADPEAKAETKAEAKPKAAAKKAAPKAAAKAKDNGAPPRKRSKDGPLATLRGLLTRKNGVSRSEALEATGWQAISFQQKSAALGLKLRIKDHDGVNRYYGTPL